MLLSILLAALSTVLFSLMIPLIFHFMDIKRRHRTLWILWVALLPIYSAGYALRSDLQPLPFLNGLFLYFIAACFLIQLYYQVERGVSMRILVEIENAPKRELRKETLMNIYSHDFILTRRLGLAVEMNLLDPRGNRFRLTAKGRFFNRIFQSLKRFYQLDPFS